MKPTIAAALQRVIDDQLYRAAVLEWIMSHSSELEGKKNQFWSGKTDAHGVPVMNICAGGPPVTVAVETIQFAIDHGRLPPQARNLVFLND
jgi:hypothetical protein